SDRPDAGAVEGGARRARGAAGGGRERAGQRRRRTRPGRRRTRTRSGSERGAAREQWPHRRTAAGHGRGRQGRRAFRHQQHGGRKQEADGREARGRFQVGFQVTTTTAERAEPAETTPPGVFSAFLALSAVAVCAAALSAGARLAPSPAPPSGFSVVEATIP